MSQEIGLFFMAKKKIRGVWAYAFADGRQLMNLLKRYDYAHNSTKGVGHVDLSH